MPINGKTADQMRDEFYAALRQERAERLEAARQLAEEMRQRDEQWKKITGEWGRFNNDEGGMVEYEGVNALRDLNEIGGMPVIAVSSAMKLTRKGREYDGVIYCPKAVVLVEFKRRLTREHVQKFLDNQMFDFTREYAEVFDKHDLYGAVAGAAVDNNARKLAEDNGLFAIRIPANRKVEILNDGAQPQKAEMQ